MSDETNTPPPSFPPGDYISPGLVRIRLDHCFPDLRLGNKGAASWEFLRRQVPHNWYVDRRQPQIGFLNRDEAHILYNSALPYRGLPTLEIGCWLGWSAAHLAMAGVQLDVIDPLLENPDIYGSVLGSLRAAGVTDRVALIPGLSPGKVFELAALRRRPWRLVFIDGNHDHPHPLNDAKAIHLVADNDALVLFHDLASPQVSVGLDYLRHAGWNTVIYQTMQIMGAAWRGAAKPVEHVPDPAVAWEVPRHLASYRISGLDHRGPINP
jgi:hypothetical protein